jgi:dipeptide/tripeptide permease
MVLMTAGLLGLSTLGPEHGVTGVVAWLALLGLGTGIFISPNSNALMGAATPARRSLASCRTRSSSANTAAP